MSISTPFIAEYLVTRESSSKPSPLISTLYKWRDNSIRNPRFNLLDQVVCFSSSLCMAYILHSESRPSWRQSGARDLSKIRDRKSRMSLPRLRGKSPVNQKEAKAEDGVRLIFAQWEGPSVPSESNFFLSLAHRTAALPVVSPDRAL